MVWIDHYFKGDRVIWLIVFILSIFSLLAVYSSTGTLAYKYQSGNTEYYMLKHFIILLLGLGIMYAAHLVNYTVYAKLSRVSLIVVIPLLILTLISGTNLNEASRWLIGRINIKYIASLIGIGILCFALFIAIAELSGHTGRIDTWWHRIENFMSGDSEVNYQTEQAKIAIAKGGTFGVGPGNSTQRNFLPHPYSDMIFALICEEYGLWGALVVIGLYVLLFYRTVLLIKQSPKAFATLFAAGCSFGLVFQAMINMAVATNLFPVTGQPLPMLSMGGTSIWFTSLSLGILLSVSRDISKEGGELAAA